MFEIDYFKFGNHLRMLFLCALTLSGILMDIVFKEQFLLFKVNLKQILFARKSSLLVCHYC